MNPKDQNIRVVSDLMRNLIVRVGSGEYRVPQFQREFVWEKQRVIELFDSIYKEYPIGSIFLWKAGRQHNRLFRHSIELGIEPIKDDDDVYFILDGQQRITSIYVTLMGLTAAGTDYGRICFDVKEERFTYRDPDPTRYVPVCEIWAGSLLNIAKQIRDEHHSALARCDQVLRTYPVSVVEVRDKELSDVCTIFQRINQSGKRLERFDLIAAMTFSPEFDLRVRFKEDLISRLQRKAFGVISPVVVTQLMALAKKGACTERVEFSLTGPEIRELWEPVVESILLAAETLRKAVGVQNSGYLPYEALLTLVAYAFLTSQRRAFSDMELEWIQRWFWRASFSQYYGSAGPTKMGRDKDLFERLLAGEFPSFDPPLSLTAESLLDTKMTRSQSAVRNAFLCLLARRNPVHLINNTPLDLVTGGISDFTSPEKHHIFPRAFLRDRGYPEATVYALPNFCFVPAELNKRISDSKPSTYFAQIIIENPRYKGAAETHLLPTGDDAGLVNDNYELFLRARSELIVEEIERLTGVSTAPAEGHEQRAITELETRLRDLIHATLSEAHGSGYWKSAVPEDVRLSVERKVSDDLKRNPERRPEDVAGARAKLEYCDLSDYSRLILVKSNWPYFESVFRRTLDVERRMEGVTRFRNALSHNRSMTEVERQDGRAALIWFRNAMSPLTDQSSTGEFAEDSNAQGLEGGGTQSIFVPKRLSRDKAVTRRSSRGEDYRKYIQALINELREEYHFTNARTAHAKGGYGFASGISGVLYAFDFSKHNRVRVSVYLDVGDAVINKAIFDELMVQRDSIEQEFGESLQWERLDGSRASRIGTYRNGSIDDSEETLDEVRSWAIERLLKFKQVFGRWLLEHPQTKKSAAWLSSGIETQWDEPAVLETIEKKRGLVVRNVAKRLIDWSKQNVSHINWGKGTNDGSFSPVLDYGAVYRLIPFRVYTYGRAEILFIRMAERNNTPFDSEGKRIELLNRLNEIPGINLPKDGINRRPSIPLSALAAEQSFLKFQQAMEWVVEEVKAAAQK